MQIEDYGICAQVQISVGKEEEYLGYMIFNVELLSLQTILDLAEQTGKEITRVYVTTWNNGRHCQPPQKVLDILKQLRELGVKNVFYLPDRGNN